MFLYNVNASENYWIKIVRTAFENNTEVTKSQNRYISSYINKRQIDYSWLPYFKLDFQQSFNNIHDDYIYNQYPNKEKI